jgi:hypothetical protein
MPPYDKSILVRHRSRRDAPHAPVRLLLEQAAAASTHSSRNGSATVTRLRVSLRDRSPPRVSGTSPYVQQCGAGR